MGKHLVIIHGRSTKPVKEEKFRLTMKALTSGLRRVSDAAAQAIEDGSVKVSFAYYGDINNRILVTANPRLQKEMVLVDGNWFEKPGSYDKDLDRLIQRETERHSYEDYRELLDMVRDIRWADDLARFVSLGLMPFDLNMKVIRRLFPDLAAYLNSRVIGSELRERLQKPLANALMADDDVALVSHSMGAMVSYDVLWKFSRMSEYEHLRGKKVSLWITIGSALGEPAVQGTLYDADEPDDGKYPNNIRNWVNISAKDDIVSADTTAIDDFQPMISQGLVENLTDIPEIYNFWTDENGSNPHKFYGYLNHPTFAGYLSQWIEA